MVDTQYSESTLPTLRHVVSEVNQAPRLHCTILFHPQVQRIGERVVIENDAGDWSLGRHWPLFSALDDDSASPLEDPYLSRSALLVSARGDGLVLCRPERASRCRVQGLELQDELFLDGASLQRGVPLLLSHSVVLLLRRCVAMPDSSAVPVCGSDAIVGSSPSMQVLRKQIQTAAASDRDVLIRGETGVGKELVARAVCGGSRRASGPLVTVNMAAVPSPLAAAFLFGNTRGAFSGAERARPGCFREADGGTLFLDEVGDTPEEIQPLLLRALQQREIQVVGGDIKTVDVRVLSATDASIDGLECDFRSALRHRLGAIEINVPTLREHPEDLGSLLMHSLRRACEQENCLDLLPGEHSEALQLARWASVFYHFSCFSWPGNVRQLENFAAQVVIASEQSPVIPLSVRTAFDESGKARERGSDGSTEQRKMSDVSEREFEEAMACHRFEVKPVAGTLGVTRQSVYRRIDKSTVYRRVSQVPVEELQQTLSDCAGDVSRSAAQLRVSESGLRARLRAAGAPGGR